MGEEGRFVGLWWLGAREAEIEVVIPRSNDVVHRNGLGMCEVVRVQIVRIVGRRYLRMDLE